MTVTAGGDFFALAAFFPNFFNMPVGEEGRQIRIAPIPTKAASKRLAN
jgi:hypothetical protein